MTKTNPKIYVECAKKIGVDISDVLFLDDNLDANRGAKQSGINVCGVYDESSKDYKQEIQQVADFYIHDFTELL
jgi:FMN phosphatase YigB (HAD superfamily)